jgi:14-3-3 protein epsilon
MLFWLARIAEKLNRTDHFIDWMNQLIAVRPKLNDRERSVFVSGHRAHLIPLREAIHIIRAHRCNAAKEGKRELRIALEATIARFRTELHGVCTALIQQIESALLPEAGSAIHRAFYKRVIGDYYRYIAETADSSEMAGWASKADAAYRAGLAFALKDVQHSHPLYLGIAVNFAVCQSELCGNRQAAVTFSEEVFNEAIKTIDGLDAPLHAEAVQAIQVLRENITKWTTPQTLVDDLD